MSVWPLWLWRGCVVVPNTQWPTDQFKWKERPVYHKHTFCPWKSEPTFQCTRRILWKKKKREDKNTPANLPQSANTVVKLTGLPDLLHTLKTTCLQVLFMNEPRCAAHAHNHKPGIVDTSIQSGKKKKKIYTNYVITTSFQLMPEVTLNNRKPVKCNY